MKAKRASRAILYVVLTIIALYTLSPLAFLLINSFKTPVSYTHLTLPTKA